MTALSPTESTRRTGALNEIVVMDDEEILAAIISALEACECRTRVVESGEEAVRLAESGSAQFFILDIHMGGDRRSQEGLNTLERIKDIDRNIFVAIYSAHSNWNYEEQAKKLGADLFVKKTADVTGDIIKIAVKMLPNALEELNRRRDRDDDPEPDPPSAEYSPEFAVNYNAFKKFISDDRNLKENLNYYVAFIDGEMVSRDKDKNRLLARLISEYPDKPKFYALVEEEEQTEELPSPMFMEDID